MLVFRRQNVRHMAMQRNRGQNDCAGKVYIQWRSDLGQISDMNVQATEAQILPPKFVGGKLRCHITLAARSSGAFQVSQMKCVPLLVRHLPKRRMYGFHAF